MGFLTFGIKGGLRHATVVMRSRARRAGGASASPPRKKIDILQHGVVERSQLHIPILFAYDTIHGYKRIIPDPARRGLSSSWDPEIAETDDVIAPRETAAVGIKEAYSPMVEVSHEPRWKRILEVWPNAEQERHFNWFGAVGQ
jgi:beta-glucosidase-like glycosyl hydrolase